MKSFFNFLKANIFPILIILICGLLAWKNYDLGTYLLGWDSLHSEFNFKDAVYRAISGVWREDQGLGAVAIHSHMADLPRIVTVWLASFIVPQNMIRYSYIFLCMFLGPLGVYYFLKYIFGQEKNDWNVRVTSFLGSIYYLLNLGTLQHFYVPFEMFTAQFAFLPWLFLYIIKYLKGDGKKNLLIFALITLVSTPMAYAATLFYAYLMGLIIFLLGYILFSNQKKQVIRKSTIIILVSLLINSFWFLPNIYSVITQSDMVSNSRINTLFSPEAFLRNRSYGDISDIIIHKSFLFGWNAFDFESNQYSALMKPWIEHLNNKNIVYIGYFVSVTYVLGLLLSLVKRNKIGLSLFGVMLLSLFFLFNENSVTSNIFKYLYDNYGIFSEGFRMPFTKFSILFIFSTSFYFAYLLFEFFKLLNKYLIGRIISVFVQVTIFTSIILYMLPAFKGNFISTVVKTNLPSEYTEVFNWFGSNDNGRVAVLPLNSLWGWENHSWKYEGSGFLSFGIKNPLLIRDFDRWSPYNETFFNQASFALSNNDIELFKKVLEKYQVKYLLLDESVINPGGEKIEEMDLGFEKVFNSGFLTIYSTHLFDDSSVSALNNLAEINADLTYSKTDPIYQKYGDYVEGQNGLGLPFVNFDTRGPIKLIIKNEELIIENKTANTKVVLPITEEIIEDFDISHGYQETTNCDLMKSGRVSRENLTDKRIYRAEDGGVACDYFVYEQLKYNQAYVMRIKGQNIEGRSLKIYLYNWESKRVELEELLSAGNFDSYFVLYPSTKINNQESIIKSGYTLNVETRSFGRIASENIIEKIEFVPFDINLVQDLYVEPTLQGFTLQGDLEIKNVKKYGTAIYKVETAGSGVLELGQGFEPGWLGFKIEDSRFKILEHIKVNGWANGFIVPTKPYTLNAMHNLIFWPQFLEWGGFVLLLITVISLILLDKKPKN